MKNMSKKLDFVNGTSDTLKDFVMNYPLIALCLRLDITASNSTLMSDTYKQSLMSSFMLNEAYMQDCFLDEMQDEKHEPMYDRSLDFYAACLGKSSKPICIIETLIHTNYNM